MNCCDPQISAPLARSPVLSAKCLPPWALGNTQLHARKLPGFCIVTCLMRINYKDDML
jgi:hypothetical protein